MRAGGSILGSTQTQAGSEVENWDYGQAVSETHPEII